MGKIEKGGQGQHVLILFVEEKQNYMREAHNSNLNIVFTCCTLHGSPLAAGISRRTRPNVCFHC